MRARIIRDNPDPMSAFPNRPGGGPAVRRRMRAPLVTIAAAAIPLAGCGSAAKVVHHRTVTIKLTEYRLTPQSIIAHKGKVTLVVVNTGRRTHNLVVSQDGTDIAATKALWPGQE